MATTFWQMENSQGEAKPILGIKAHSKPLSADLLLSSPLKKGFNQGFLGGKAQPFQLSMHLTGGLYKGMFGP
ncbi:MAG: hypothetical protein F4226_07895 [Synechococcus sp. SB0678_bin_12]|nr:hypothetical protein [Synechococcus sp. SB0678_bin_12]